MDTEINIFTHLRRGEKSLLLHSRLRTEGLTCPQKLVLFYAFPALYSHLFMCFSLNILQIYQFQRARQYCKERPIWILFVPSSCPHLSLGITFNQSIMTPSHISKSRKQRFISNFDAQKII